MVINDDKKQMKWMSSVFPFIGNLFKDDDCQDEFDDRKEIHFMSKIGRYSPSIKDDFESTKNAIERNDSFILTTQFSFLIETDKLVDNGYRIFIHSNGNTFEIV